MKLVFFSAIHSKDYLKMPKAIAESQLKGDEKFIISYFGELASHTKYKDTDGTRYIVYTKAKMEQKFGYGRSKYDRVIRNLKKGGYITVKRVGDGKYNQIYPETLTSSSYVEIPRWLTRAEFSLSLEQIVLYSHLRELSFASIEKGYIEDDGRIFVAVSYVEAATYLGCSDDTAKCIINGLIDAGVIEKGERRKTHNGLPQKFKLYVKEPETEIGKKLDDVVHRKIDNLDSEKNDIQESEKSGPNYPEFSNNLIYNQSAYSQDRHVLNENENAKMLSAKYHFPSTFFQVFFNTVSSCEPVVIRLFPFPSSSAYAVSPVPMKLPRIMVIDTIPLRILIALADLLLFLIPVQPPFPRRFPANP